MNESKLYKAVFEASPDAIIVTNEEGLITLINHQAEILFAYNSKEIIGCAIEKLIPQRFAVVHQQHRIAFTKEPVTREMGISKELVAVNKHGIEFPVDVMLSPMHDEDHTSIILVVRDVTERKVMLDNIREKENRYKLLVDNATEALVVLDVEAMKFISASKSAEQLFKMTKKELLHMSMLDLSPEYQPNGLLSEVMAKQKVQEALDGAKPVFEWLHQDSAGKLIPCEVRLVKLPDEKKRILVRGSITDITERIEATNELKKKKDLFRMLLNKLDAGIVVHRPDTSIDSCNPMAEELLGLTEDQMKGKLAIDKDWMFLLEDGSIMPIEQYPVNMILRTKDTIKNRICGVNRPSTRDVVWLQVTGYPVFDANHLIEEVVISFIDVTASRNARIQEAHSKEELQIAYQKLSNTNKELREANQDIIERKITERALEKKSAELARANEELEQFAFAASHDLQEPLRTISNFSGLLSKKLQDLDSEDKEYFQFITNATSRMQRLIKALLDFSKIGRKVEFDQVDCDELMKAVINDMQGSLSEADVMVDFTLPRSIIANEIELKQLFQNLISNSIKFRRPDVPCQIAVHAEEREQDYYFQFSDNGIGIEDKYRERIFIIFQRLHPEHKYAGTGIGLATCQKIVTQHGGKIWVESVFGQGSTFHFSISKELSL